MKKLNCILVAVLFSTSGFAGHTAGSMPAKPQTHTQSVFKRHAAGQTATSVQRMPQRFVPGTETNYIYPSNTWLFSDTAYYIYNAAGQVTRRTTVGTGGPMQRELTTYNAAGLTTEYIYQYYNSSTTAWENSSRYTTAYDAQGNETLSESFNWQNNAWELQNSNKTLNTYNGANQLTQAVYQILDTSTGIYENDYRDQYAYNGSGQLNDFMGAIWNNGAWENDFRATNIVWHQWNGSLNNSILQAYTGQVWSGSAWTNDERMTATFGAFDSFVEVYETYQNGIWTNSYRYSVTNDSQLNEIESKDEDWNGAVWTQSYGRKYLLTYDMQNRLTERVVQQFNATSMQYENQLKSVYSNFSTVTALASLVSVGEVSVYPNPFITTATVSLRIDASAQASLVLFDLTGKAIKSQQVTNGSNTITREGLSAGMYFYQVQQNGQKIATGKLSIQ